MARPAAFLDRDGTLIEDAGYLSQLDQIRFLPGAIEAVRLLNAAGFFVAVVTNQSGVARGYFSTAFVEATHEAIQKALAEAGAHIDAFYFCPHFEKGEIAALSIPCECRKPRPGMFRQAELEHGPFTRPSFMFGDRDSDMGFAVAAGLDPCLVGAADMAAMPSVPRYASLLDAVQQRALGA